MDPSAQNIPNPMEQQIASSSQLGGGANGDHSRINGDQVIVNPLSSQLRDQQQAQMAAQIAATNKAQAMLNMQTQQHIKQSQQAQQKPAGQAPTPLANTASQQPNGVIQQGATQATAPQQGQPAKPPTPGLVTGQASQQPVPTQPGSNPPGTNPGTIQSPAAQNQAMQQATQSSGNSQNSVPQTQPSGQTAQQQDIAQQSQPAAPNGQGINPSSTAQQPNGIVPMQSPAPQAVQQPIQQQVSQGQQIASQQQNVQQMNPQQMVQPQIQGMQVQQQAQPQSMPNQQSNGMVPGPIQNPVQQPMQQQPMQTQPGMMPSNQIPVMQSAVSQNPIPQTQPVQFVSGGQGPIGQSVQPFQAQQNLPQTQPVSFQTFAPQAQQPQQDADAAQQGEVTDQSTISAQQIISDTFIPVAQLISNNHDPIQDLHNTVASSNVPDELRVVLNDRIKRLGQIKEGAGLSSMYILELESTTRYINACVGLPWVNKTEDTLDLAKAKEILDQHHYGLDMLKNRMLEFIASIMLNLKNNGPDFASRSPILCFVGLAGTGKTTFAKSMAEALGRKFERIPFGGMADSRALRGQSRYFPDAEPGQFMKSLSRAQSKNPVLLLDEIDRVTETARADIMGVLIEALDPEQNAAFTDHYIDYPFSLQNCLFVATSNNISTIATAVLDRMEIIQMPNYNDAEKKVIGRDYVLPKVRKQMGLREDQLIIDDGVWDALIRPLGYDPGVRALDRIIGMICRRAARMIVAGEAENVRVSVNNMKPFVQDF